MFIVLNIATEPGTFIVLNIATEPGKYIIATEYVKYIIQKRVIGGNLELCLKTPQNLVLTLSRQRCMMSF